MMGNAILMVSVLLVPAVLAFVVARRFGRRTGFIVLAGVVVLNLPALAGFIPVLSGTSSQSNVYPDLFPPAERGWSASTHMFLGAMTFAAVSVGTALVAVLLGARVKRGEQA